MPTTDAILAQIESVGYAVSTFRLQSSLKDIIPPAVEIHAVALKVDPPEQFIAHVDGDIDESAYCCACVLAEMVEIKLADG